MKFTNINIGKRLSITIGFTILLILTLSLISYRTISKLTDEWEQFHTVSLEKFVAVSKGNNKLGDAIHHFKNYLLRGQDYDQKFIADMDAIDQATASYANNHGAMNEREKSALNRIKEGGTAYRTAIKKAVEMKAAGASIEEIDKSIQGADKAIGAAFDELQAVAQEETTTTSKLIATTAIGGQRTIVILCLMAAMIAAIFGVWIVRSILQQLGGDPAYAAEVVSKIADGDLTVQVEIRANDNSSMLFAIKSMADKLTGIVTDVRTNTESITIASQEIAQGNADLSHRTEQQAASLEETASSMEELNSTVHQNAENAKHASQLAASASDIAIKGGQAVSDVVETMASISASSGRIMDIIGVIEGIAFQTNILALNAAVEAARAGEEGRGFAVVASEVRNLAQRSAASAKEIKILIDDSVNKVYTGSKQVNQAGVTMNEVVEAVKRVTDIMAEISAASVEQSAGIEEVNTAITQMDEATQQNAALVEEASAAAESMRAQANTLMHAVSLFKLETSRTQASATRPATAHRARHHAPAAPAKSTRRLSSKAQENKDGNWKEF